MVFVRNWPFFHFFFQDLQARKISFLTQKNVFNIFQNQKKLFQAIKRKSSKSRKIENFFKGVSPCFWSKIGYFSIFLFQDLQARKMSFTIFQNEKNPFLGYKNKKFNQSKIEIFASELDQGFCQQLAIFPFFSRTCRPGKFLLQPRKMCLRYSRTKKSFFGL